MKKFNAFLLVALVVVLVVFRLGDKENHSTQVINLSLNWQQQAIGCQSTFIPDNASNAWFIEQLHFFLSDFQVADRNGHWQPLTLKQTIYQTSELVLIGDNCRQSTNPLQHDSNWHIELADEVDFTSITKLAFTLGVPFVQNHKNPIMQKSPLNIPSMFWVWQTGHKFMRLEMASSDQQWLFHLGSTGCTSASVMRAPAKECRYPNRFEFEINIDQNHIASTNEFNINVELANLLKNIKLMADSNCQSEATFSSCQQLFDNLAKSTVLGENEQVFQQKGLIKG